MIRFKVLVGLALIAIVSATPSRAVSGDADGRKTLIAFFSRTGNTRALASIIQARVGGDMVELRPAVPYSDVYRETVDRHIQERDSGAFPELASSIEKLDEYDVIFLGFPNWGSTMPRLMFTFLRDSRLAGKTIVPFCTHGGGGLGRSIEDIRSMRPDATVMMGFGVNGSAARQSGSAVERWLHENGLLSWDT